MRAALLVLLSCSEYDLHGGGDKTRPGQHDTAGPSGSGDGELDSADSDPADTGDTPADTDDPPIEGKLDVLLLVDVAYDYDCYHPDVAQHGADLARALLASGSDVAMAIGTFDDYAGTGNWWTAWGGRPYTLVQQLTTSESLLVSAAGSLELTWGGDGPGSGHEALVQGVLGGGYDQDCDGSYARDTDVLPFVASSADAFGGGGGQARDASVPGTGSEGGVGFRSGATRVVILAADNQIRDPEQGDSLPSGTCPDAASRYDAVSALNSTDTHLLSINAYEFQDLDPTLQAQLESLADATDSWIDADGDGAQDDPAVFSGSWDWPSTSALVAAIFELAGSR